MNGLPAPTLGETRLICELRGLPTKLAKALSPNQRQRQRAREVLGPKGANTLLGVANQWVQIAQQNPLRRLLVCSVALGGPIVLSPTPLQGGATPVGVSIALGFPLLINERDWLAAVGWEWWAITGAAPSRLCTFEVIEA